MNNNEKAKNKGIFIRKKSKEQIISYIKRDDETKNIFKEKGILIIVHVIILLASYVSINNIIFINKINSKYYIDTDKVGDLENNYKLLNNKIDNFCNLTNVKFSQSDYELLKNNFKEINNIVQNIFPKIVSQTDNRLDVYENFYKNNNLELKLIKKQIGINAIINKYTNNSTYEISLYNNNMYTNFYNNIYENKFSSSFFDNNNYDYLYNRYYYTLNGYIDLVDLATRIGSDK